MLITNDRQKILGNIDFNLYNKTRLSASVTAGSTDISVQNASGFSTSNFGVIGNVFTENSELVTISSINGNVITINSATVFSYSIKDIVYCIPYDTINFYENDLLIGNKIIATDFYTVLDHSVNLDALYSYNYENSNTNDKSSIPDAINGWEYLLCTEKDILALENINTMGVKIIDKIKIASDTIRDKFAAQSQVFSNMAQKDKLRLPTALLALYYYFLELIKQEGDTAWVKTRQYKQEYEAKIAEVYAYINATDTNIKMWGTIDICR